MSDDLARTMREFCEACRRAAPVTRRLLAIWAEYEAERAVAHFEGRVPPSLEVWAAERGQ